MAESVMDSRVEFVQPVVGKTLAGSVGGNETLKWAFGGATLEWTSVAIAATVLVLTVVFLFKAFTKDKSKKLPPVIPGGYPFLGNLMQLSEAKPHRTFTDWTQKYGPIFSIRTGSLYNVVINSADLAREAFVAKHSIISIKQHYTAMEVLTCGKKIVAMSDYGPHHILLKKVYVGNLLGPTVQKQNRPIRERALTGLIEDMYTAIGGQNSHPFNVTDCIKKYLWPFTLEQTFGYVPEEIYVPGLGKTLGKWELYQHLVENVLTSVVSIDYRNFFPSLSFLGNKPLDKKLQDVVDTRAHIMNALLAKQRKLIAERGPTECYVDILLTQYADWSELQILMSSWEPLIEGVDSTLITIEWAMYEVIRTAGLQERLYKEMKDLVGDRMVTEDDLDKLPLLTAVLQETLRVYTALPVLPPRRVTEDTTIGGYFIPKNTDILLNLYAVNMDPAVWDEPNRWNPDRVLNDKKLDMGVRDFRMLPFGGGVRMCQGIRQVFAVVPMCIAGLVLHFDWAEAALTVEEKNAEQDCKILTTHKLHPVRAVAKPRVDSRIKWSEEKERSLWENK